MLKIGKRFTLSSLLLSTVCLANANANYTHLYQYIDNHKIQASELTNCRLHLTVPEYGILATIERVFKVNMTACDFKSQTWSPDYVTPSDQGWHHRILFVSPKSYTSADTHPYLLYIGEGDRYRHDTIMQDLVLNGIKVHYQITI